MKFQISYILTDQSKTRETFLKYGASEKFIEDFERMVETYHDHHIIHIHDIVNNIFVFRCYIIAKLDSRDTKIIIKFGAINLSFQYVMLNGLKEQKANDERITVNDVKAFFDEKSQRQDHRIIDIDALKVVQSMLSKQLQPEQYNGIMNFLYLSQTATPEQIESVLVM